nr:uncharacterized protein LOC107374568 isoform X1 [Nothobranchius furzeri]
MWDLYSSFSIQKREPERFTQEQKETIQRAHTSVTRWLNTPVTRSTSVQMRRFRKYVHDRKQQEESSSSQRDPLSSLDDDDDAEQVAASVEDSLTSERPVTGDAETRKLLKTVAAPASTAAAGPPGPSAPAGPPGLASAAGCSAAVLDPHIAESKLLLPSGTRQQNSSTLNPDEDTFRQQQDADVPPQHPTSSDGELDWVKAWQDEGGIPLADQTWLREDQERGLYTPAPVYRDENGFLKHRRGIRSDCMWFYPPEPPGFVGGAVPGPQLFFRSRVFVWRPVGVWRCSLKCPRGDECAGKGHDVYLYQSGFHHQVRHICDVSSWYTLLTEVLCCGPCTKAAGAGGGGTVGRWPAWDPAVVSQLSEAHQALFPAVLTSECGVDKNVVRLFRDRTKDNAMVKVWSLIQEFHTDEHLHRIDLYTTLLMTLVKPGGVASAFRHKFERPPPARELPSAQLLRQVFLLAEAQNVLHHRAQIPSTSGPALSFHATRQPVTKLTSISAADVPPTPLQPAVLPPPSYPVTDFKFTESTAGTKDSKRTDLVMPVSRSAPQPQPGSQTPMRCEPVVASSASLVSKSPGHAVRPILPKVTPVQSSSVSSQPPGATATSSPSPSWSRATLYKRKQQGLSFLVGGKKSRVQNNPVCTICGQMTQGHNKYKNKAFCPVKKMSTSKGLTGIKFERFEDFKLAVDSKDAAV